MGLLSDLISQIKDVASVMVGNLDSLREDFPSLFPRGDPDIPDVRVST
jgi:hypothetical protein